jgi:probable HAF family extracellular repeat protein
MAAAWTALVAGSASAQPSFRHLGFLDPTSNGPSIANGVSADGSVVVGMSNSTTGTQAFRWTAAGGMVGLGAFPNPGGFPSSQAFVVSADGQVIGGASVRPASLNEDGSAFRWTMADGMTFAGSLGGTEGGSVHGLTRDGSVMVGAASSPDFSYRAFIWRSGTGPVALPDVLHQAQSAAQALTSDASLIVGSADINFMANPHPATWTLVNGSYVSARLPELNVNAVGSALAVTPDGSVIAGQSAGRAVTWTSAGIQNLGLIPGGLAGTTYLATAISADGGTVVGLGDYNVTQGTGTAFIWDAVHGMRDLNLVLTGDFGLDLHGFVCFYARGISADGKVIVGYGFSDVGQEAFVADLHTGPPPCYPNCDGSTTAPILNVNDFICFQSLFASGDPRANCDGSTNPPILNVNDFVCFQSAFAAGCP